MLLPCQTSHPLHAFSVQPTESAASTLSNSVLRGLRLNDDTSVIVIDALPAPTSNFPTIALQVLNLSSTLALRNHHSIKTLFGVTKSILYYLLLTHCCASLHPFRWHCTQKSSRDASRKKVASAPASRLRMMNPTAKRLTEQDRGTCRYFLTLTASRSTHTYSIILSTNHTLLPRFVFPSLLYPL